MSRAPDDVSGARAAVREPTELTVPDSAAGVRLDRFLAAPLGSRARAQTLIDAERVLVDGRPRAKRYGVHPGEVIQIASSTGAH